MGIFDTASKKIFNFLGMTALGQKTKATALGVTLASDEDALAVTAAQLPAALGQDDMAGSLPVVIASNQTAIPINNVASNTLFVGEDLYKYKIAGSVVDVNTTPYSAGDQLGVKITLTNLFRATGASVRLRSVTVIDKSKQKSAFHILFFDANPSNTVISNNSAFDVDGLDIDKVVAQVTVAAADYKDCTTQSYACIQCDIPIVAETGVDSGYIICVCDGTPTYAEHALQLTLEFARNAG